MTVPLKKERLGGEPTAESSAPKVPESAPPLEAGVERGKERSSAQTFESAKPDILQKSIGSVPAPRVIPQAKKDPVQTEVERILAEDIEELFQALPKDRQEKFNTRGDEVAGEVFGMMARAKANAKKIFKLIRAWLMMIPGINRFFLEQEAKIKTDRLMALAEREKDGKGKG
ncbi:MAG: hypothetical protein AAB444_00335 [Patescibacteria group bacterium]